MDPLREDCQAELREILDSLRGHKYLVVDTSLQKLLYEDVFDVNDQFESDSLVRRFALSGEKSIKIAVEKNTAVTIPDNIIYLTRPHFATMKAVAGQIRQCVEMGWKSQHHVYFVPHRTIACEQILEDEGVLQYTTVGEYRLGFVPIDSDLITLGMKDVYREMCVDGDSSSLSAVASALLRLQHLYGPVPHVRCKGVAARKIMLQLARLRATQAHEFGFKAGHNVFPFSSLDVDDDDDDDEAFPAAAIITNTTDLEQNSVVDAALDDGDEDNRGNTNATTKAAVGVGGDGTSSSGRRPGPGPRPRLRFDALFIVDREVDLVSPLVTPLTYEGLLTELMCRDYGRVAVGGNEDDKQQQQQQQLDDQQQSSSGATVGPVHSGGVSGAGTSASSREVKLDDTDSIFAEIRHLSIEHIGPRLQAKAIEVKLRYANFRGNKDASISEIHDFVKKMPQLTEQYKSLNMHIGLAQVLKQTSEARMFRERWQIERGLLEGDLGASANLDLIEDYLLGYCSVGGEGQDGAQEESADADTDAGTERSGGAGGTSSTKHLCAVLRLLCLQSLTAGGIRASRYDAVRRAIVQAFGYRHSLTLRNLERAGYLRRKDNMTLMGVESVSAQSVAAMANIMNMASASSTATAASGAPHTGSQQHHPANTPASNTSGSEHGGGSNATSGDVGGGGVTDWQVLRKQLRLLGGNASAVAAGAAEDSCEAKQQRQPSTSTSQGGARADSSLCDISYAAAGYAPLIARLVQLLYSDALTGPSPGGRGMPTMTMTGTMALPSDAQAMLRLLPGPLIELCGMDQECANHEDLGESIARSSNAANDNAASSAATGLHSAQFATASKKSQRRKRTLAVLVVGGISVLEIAALRCLSRDPSFPYRIVMATTEVLRGDGVMASFFPE